MVFQQGDLGDCVYVIEEGECDVLCERKGEQEHLATLGRGAYFGEMALLSNKTRNATLRARTAMDVVIIPKADFNKLRQSVPAFADLFSELAKQRAGAVAASQSQSPGASSDLYPACPPSLQAATEAKP